MLVLVIGGAVYISSQVVIELLDQGHQVTVFDNLFTGSQKKTSELVYNSIYYNHIKTL